MKNLSLLLNGLLIIAVGILFYFQFATKNVENTLEERTVGENAVENIVFVNIDSLVNNYDLYFDLKESLFSKQKDAEAKLNSKKKAYEKQVMDFQNKVQKGLVTRAQAQELQQQLMLEEQNLMAYNEQLRGELIEQEQVMLRQIQAEIEDYLVEFNKTQKYAYVLSRSFGGQVLYSDKSLDITKEVLEGLNQTYAQSKK